MKNCPKTSQRFLVISNCLQRKPFRQRLRRTRLCSRLCVGSCWCACSVQRILISNSFMLMGLQKGKLRMGCHFEISCNSRIRASREHVSTNKGTPTHKLTKTCCVKPVSEAPLQPTVLTLTASIYEGDCHGACKMNRFCCQHRNV